MSHWAYPSAPLKIISDISTSMKFLYRWEAAANIAELWINTTKSRTLDAKYTECCLSLRNHSIHLQHKRNKLKISSSSYLFFPPQVKIITKIKWFYRKSMIHYPYTETFEIDREASLSKEDSSTPIWLRSK